MQTHPLESGLNDLSLFPQEPKRRESLCRSFSSLLSSSSTVIGDYIGMESCVDVLSDGDQSELLDRSRSTAAIPGERGWHRRSSSAAAAANCRREFPPPIPSLAQTENLQSRMPWVLRRHYTGDGRLILTEEKVRHHEYFRAHRSNGRLTLHLVPLDGAVLPPPVSDHSNEIIEKESNDNVDDHNQDHHDQEEGGSTGGGDDHECGEIDGGDEEEECRDDDKNGNEKQGIVGGGTGGGNKCYNYSGGRCILGVPVPAIRPVHS